MTPRACFVIVATSALLASRASVAQIPPPPAHVKILSPGINSGELSPDGAWIAYFARGGVVVASAQGQIRETIRTPVPAITLAWAPDSRSLALYADNQATDRKYALYSYRLGSRRPRLVTDEPSLQFSFDARGRLQYLRRTRAGTSAPIELWRAGDTAPARTITPPIASGGHHQLLRDHMLTTPDRRSATVAELWITDLATGKHRKVIDGAFGDFAVSPDEDRLCYVRDRTVRCVTVANGRERVVANVPGSCEPRLGERPFSPSGHVLTFGDCRFGGLHISLYDFDSELVRPLFTGSGFAAWSMLDDRTLVIGEHVQSEPRTTVGYPHRSPAKPALIAVDVQSGARAVLAGDDQQYQHLRPVRGQGGVLVLSRTRDSVDDLVRLELRGALSIPWPKPPPRDGSVTEYYASGKKHLEAHYRAGKLHGTRTVWYWNGTKHEQGDFRANVPHGTWTTWYASGRKAESFPWVDGKLEGPVVTWYMNGVKASQIDHVDNHTHGLEIRWDDRGNKILEVRHVRGKRDGVEVTWKNGRKYSEKVYADGVPHGSYRQWDERGQIGTEGRYVRGKQHGTWSGWYRGKPFTVRNFDHGKEHGPFKEYWDSGRLRREGAHDHGLRVGTFTSYHQDGRMAEQGEFRANKKHGVWRTWNRWSGKVTEETYQDGQRVH